LTCFTAQRRCASPSIDGVDHFEAARHYGTIPDAEEAELVTCRRVPTWCVGPSRVSLMDRVSRIDVSASHDETARAGTASHSDCPISDDVFLTPEPEFLRHALQQVDVRPPHGGRRPGPIALLRLTAGLIASEACSFGVCLTGLFVLPGTLFRPSVLLRCLNPEGVPA
jgi:hypothetical protein